MWNAGFFQQPVTPLAVKSCCCMMSTVNSLDKPVEHADFMSYKCSCRWNASTQGTCHLTDASASSHEDYRCRHSQDTVGTADLPRASVSAVSGHSQCTCRAESQPLSGAHCTVCWCCRGLKLPENLVHIVRCDQAAKDAGHSRGSHCCTCPSNCTHDLGISICQHSITLSNIAASICPHCTKFSQVSRPEQPHSQLTSRYAELCSIQGINSRTTAQSGTVIMDVGEWQHQHFEQLHRQKLEVCHRASNWNSRGSVNYAVM